MSSENITPAKCPHCFGEKADCAACGGSGCIAVKIPDPETHQLWLRVCGSCGEEVGGCFTGEGLPPLRDLRNDKCVFCGAFALKHVEVRP